jgi:extracellular factor (EF) 3-hydroxypalmitic acid methyl ester biosynthesis protein
MLIPQALTNKTQDLLAALKTCNGSRDYSYEVVEAQLSSMKYFVQDLERKWHRSTDEADATRAWFRTEAAPVLQTGRLMRRANVWPEGHPGDYITLEAVYENRPEGDGLPLHLDRYFLSRTLAVALRARLRKLAEILNRRALEDVDDNNWLNLACGSCRELLNVPPRAGRNIHCLDSDQNALNFAKTLIGERTGERIAFHAENAFRLLDARRNIERFGLFTTIYSAGLFDYLKDDQMVRLLSGLRESIANGGMLIAPIKDARCYETFDYHWLVKWDYFLQRQESDFLRILVSAGFSESDISTERDESGVIVFFLVRR